MEKRNAYSENEMRAMENNPISSLYAGKQANQSNPNNKSKQASVKNKSNQKKPNNSNPKNK